LKTREAYAVLHSPTLLRTVSSMPSHKS
jgi:hypothetical protein